MSLDARQKRPTVEQVKEQDNRRAILRKYMAGKDKAEVCKKFNVSDNFLRHMTTGDNKVSDKFWAAVKGEVWND